MSEYATRLIENGVAIFLFHGVIESTDTTVRNYTRKHLKKDYFVAVLRELKANGNAISMEDFVEHQSSGRPLPPHAFAITFDDGFENNLTVAAPILRDERIPATFYVTTDFVDRNQMSWIDRIEYVLEEAPAGRLHLPWGERDFDNPDSKRALLDDIRKRVKFSDDIDADMLASNIQTDLGFDEIRSSDHVLDRKMTWAQVRDLAAQNGIAVGGHSHTHAILSFLNQAELHAEIGASARLLTENANLSTRHYSYPEGLRHCYSDSVIEALKNFGVVCCPTAEAGVNGYNADLFHLKRVMVV